MWYQQNSAPKNFLRACSAKGKQCKNCAFGAGGLGLSGVGSGGGGRGEGIGLGSVGAVGRGAGVGSERPNSPGRVVAGVGGASISGGGLGAVASGAGTGSGQGFGSGQGRLSGAHRVAPPRVAMGATTVSGSLSSEVIARVVRPRLPALRRCADAAAVAGVPSVRFAVRFTIGAGGRVTRTDLPGPPQDPALAACVLAVFRSMTFPEPEGGEVTVNYPFLFDTGSGAPSPDAPGPAPPADAPRPPDPPPHIVTVTSPYVGRYAEVMSHVDRGASGEALAAATAWHRDAPGDVMALVALGEALEASGAIATAARAYGSLLDLFPARADLRRFAGEHLDRLAGEAPRALAIDTYDKAAKLRPDHPSSHRLLAFARLRGGDPAGAFEALERGLRERYPGGRFSGVQRVIAEDLGLVAAAWIKIDPSRRAEVTGRLTAAGATLEVAPSLRFVLSWETDANDVDLHVRDADGGHAYYSSKTLPSGGALYADVTTGYGPECFTVRGPRAARSRSYSLQAHYYARGPMGYGMGKLEVVDHDGAGGISFEERPFVVMVDRSFVDLGVVDR